MTEHYDPTTKEIFGEVVTGVKQYFSRDNLENIGDTLKQTGVNFLVSAGLFSICPYVLPTTIREVRGLRSSSAGETQLDATDHVGFTAGLVGSVALGVAQVLGYKYAVENNHPEALLLPVVTNVASGAYEVGRSMYNSARQRVVDRQKVEGLEATLQ